MAKNIYTPNADAVQRIQRAVRKVEGQPLDLSGGRRHPIPGRSGFWAVIDGATDYATAATTGRGHSWRKVVMSPGGGWWQDPEGLSGTGTAHNMAKCLCPPSTVVLLNFIGFIEEDDGQGNTIDVPHYAFVYGQPQEHTGIKPHDHRDNFNGGFAFSVYHPGTALPQMPWAL